MADEPMVETVWGERMTEKAFERLLKIIFDGTIHDPDLQQDAAEGDDAA